MCEYVCVCVRVLCVCACVCVYVCVCVCVLRTRYMIKVGQNHIHIYGVYAVILAGKTPNVRSYTVHVYGSGPPYV